MECSGRIKNMKTPISQRTKKTNESKFNDYFNANQQNYKQKMDKLTLKFMEEQRRNGDFHINHANQCTNITRDVIIGFDLFKKDYTQIDDIYFCLKKEYLKPKIDRMWRLDELVNLYIETL